MRFATAVTLAVAALYGPLAEATPQRFHQTHKAMGTEFTIDIFAESEAVAAPIMASAFEEIDRMEALLSNYQSTSELSRISREAGGTVVTTDPETFRFLERAFYWSRQSDGAFDITVGPLLRTWGFFLHGGRVPSAKELTDLSARVGWRKVTLNPEARSIQFSDHRSMDLDPGSIGKGFAVDSVVTLLRKQGITSAFISAGNSTLYAIGSLPGTEGWPVDIPDPRHAGVVAATIHLKDSSLSTGACTEKFFIKDGHRYCHIFNPITMKPVEGMLQTTVIDPSATDSDALSTVVFVLDPGRSQNLLASMNHTQALIFSNTSAQNCTAIHWVGNPCHSNASSMFEDPQR